MQSRLGIRSKKLSMLTLKLQKYLLWEAKVAATLHRYIHFRAVSLRGCYEADGHVCA